MLGVGCQCSCSVANAPGVDWEFVTRVQGAMESNERNDQKVAIIRALLQRGEQPDLDKAREIADKVFRKTPSRVWPGGLIFPPDASKNSYLQLPWLFIPILVILKQGGFTLFQRCVLYFSFFAVLLSHESFVAVSSFFCFFLLFSAFLSNPLTDMASNPINCLMLCERDAMICLKTKC